jgi:ribosome biogenesis GTPase
MSKRKLSKQQRSRIDLRQQRSGTRQSESDNSLQDDNLGPERTGIISCHFGQQLDVEGVDDQEQAKVFRCFQRSNLPPLVCGDRVIYRADSDDTGVVVALEERKSVFSRPAQSGELRPVASNIDLVMIVIAAKPAPFQNLVDRYLVAVETLQLKPLILINKTDLEGEKQNEDVQSLKLLYSQLGYQVVQVSAHSGDGIDDLKQRLQNRTAVIVGQSGVGKSSIINKLNPGFDTPVGALSANRDKGTHTTTASRLFHLDGCDLIDSPGIREFGLWHIEPQELLEGFIEFRPYLGGCKFRDCSHTSEPECALLEAVEAGSIAPQRMASFIHIRESLT